MQKFACKMITRKWDKGYDDLLNMTNLPSLADRRLCSLYKIVHNLVSWRRLAAGRRDCVSPTFLQRETPGPSDNCSGNRYH